MRVRLGIDDCFAVKRWPTTDTWASIVRGRLGLHLVQHSFDLVDLDIDDPALFRQELDDAGIELHSTFTGLAAYSSNLLLHPLPAARAAALAWYRRAIGWTADAGGRATGGHIGAFAVADWTDEELRAERWEDMRTALGGLAREARRAGLDHLLVENLAAAREPSTMSMIRDLVTDGAPGPDGAVPIRLCLDVGHMCVAGTSGAERDPYAWLREMAPLATVVQLQQSDAAGDHHWPFTPAMNRAGRIDADRTIDALGESGVKEIALVLEVIPPFEQEDDAVVDDLVASVDYWREALSRRGVLVA